MSDAVTTAVIGAVALLGGVGLTYITAQLVRLNQRIQKLEHRDRLSWLYIKALIDHAYRYTDIVNHPLPEPPEGWLEETTR